MVSAGRFFLLSSLACALAAGQTSAQSHGLTSSRSGATWYLDCSRSGSAGNGKSPEAAWNSTAALAEHEFGPGDSILLRRGTTCEGGVISRGSGSAASPIRLDAWGVGPLPRIHARSGERAALLLSDQQYWSIAHLEFVGGEPYGIYITGTRGVLHGIHIRDVVVHDVTGEPKEKDSGLVVIAPGNHAQRFDDVLVDGVTAYRTTQWAGILVGTAREFLPAEGRSTNVVVRNSIVHGVAGDGIILFQVIHGLIENSVAWHTGMQPTQTIGTPNAIWTWMCRDCIVRRNEAFLVDSPGVDGGAFDVDYGNTDNVVEDNYGHDTQGYCVAVFAAGSGTTNTVVRGNVCAGNGRSPRLARRQGAVFLDTWNGGIIRGLTVQANRIFWDPPIAAPVVVDTAAIEGPVSFREQEIHSSSPFFIRSNGGLTLDHNDYIYLGESSARWVLGGKTYSDFANYQREARQDHHSRFSRENRASRSP